MTQKNSHAKNAIENGLTTQLTSSVMTSPVGRVPDVTNRGEIDLHHHRHDHQPDEHSDRQIDMAALTELHRPQCLDKAWGYLPEHHARDHTEHDPDREIKLKGIQLLLDYWWRVHQRGLHGLPE